MCDQPPRLLDGAVVEMFASARGAESTGRTRHYVGGEPVTWIDRLAIARYDDAENVYLFYCDEGWAVITDTWHETAEDAIAQAEFEFEGLIFERV
ncbi:hypothetical protein [Nocardia sp. NPDC060259]|uniref:hypothetical protein n=1 Tax=Nocardia sp. NPDC060259 TaxID=3347088 RepID=UPI0036570A27